MYAFGPDSPAAFRRYFEKEALPFPGVSAPPELLSALGQQWRLLGFGRQPALIGLKADGTVGYTHFGTRPQDLPDLTSALEAIAPR